MSGRRTLRRKETLRRFSAGLTVVHAYGGEALAFSELPLTDPGEEEARASEERRLREFVEETFPGQHVESIADLGEAGTVIHKIVQTQGTDLVMLALEGRGPIRRFLLGSVAAKVLHDVSAAVWTGTSSYPTEHAPRLPYRSLLCPRLGRNVNRCAGRDHRACAMEEKREFQKGDVLWTEFGSKDVYRRFEVPNPIDVEKLTARLEKGILRINAPEIAPPKVAAIAA